MSNQATASPFLASRLHVAPEVEPEIEKPTGWPSWSGVRDEIMLAFVFSPDESIAFEMCEGFHENQKEGTMLTAVCNLQDNDVAQRYNLSKSVVQKIELVGAEGSPAIACPLFLSLFIGCEREGKLAPLMTGLDGKYPLSVRSSHPTLFQKRREDPETHQNRETYGRMCDDLISQIVEGVQANGVQGDITLPAALIPTVKQCFKRDRNKDDMQSLRDMEAKAKATGSFTVTREEFTHCEAEITQVLCSTRESFDDGSSILAILSLGSDEESASINLALNNKPYYVYVNMTFVADIIDSDA